MTVTACTGDARAPAPAPGVVTIDSAGVVIAEIRGDPWNARPWATLDTTNAVRIVPNDARPETLFGRVRDVLRLPDGRIAVLDGRRYQVILFSPEGSLIRTLGRRGQGPGEFRYPQRLIRAVGDSIGVAEATHVEIMALDASASRRVQMPAIGAGLGRQILGAFDDGGYLAMTSQGTTEAVVGRHEIPATLSVVMADGSAGPTLGRHALTEYSYRDGGAEGPIEVETHFWEEPGFAMLADGYVTCRSTRFECEVWSRDGRRVRVIRATALPPAVTDADVDEFTAIRLAEARSREDSVRSREYLAVAHWMERMPALSRLLTDPQGRVWMRGHVWRPDDRAAPWLVFESTGEIVGTVMTPAGFEVYDIGDDYTLGVERDADGVESIVLYPHAIRSGLSG